MQTSCIPTLVIAQSIGQINSERRGQREGVEPAAHLGKLVTVSSPNDWVIGTEQACSSDVIMRTSETDYNPIINSANRCWPCA